MRLQLRVAAFAFLAILATAAVGLAQQPDASKTMLSASIYRIELSGLAELPGKFESAAAMMSGIAPLRGKQLKSLEMIRMQTLAGVPANVQFGRQVPVVTGVASRGGATTRSIRTEQFGSQLGLQTRLEDGKVYAEVEFEASHPTMLPNADGEERPEYERRSMQTITSRGTVYATLGEVTLLHQQQNEAGGVVVYIQFQEGNRAASRSPQRRAFGSGGRSGRSTTRGDDARAARADASHSTYANALMARYDRDGDGKVTYEEMDRSGVLRQLRDQKFASLKAGEHVTVAEVARAMMEAGYFSRSRPSASGRHPAAESTKSPKSTESPRADATERAKPSEDAATEATSESRATTKTDSAPESRYLTYAKLMIAKYDRDKDGTLNEKELASIAILGALNSRQKIDADGDGKVTHEELARRLKDR